MAKSFTLVETLEDLEKLVAILRTDTVVALDTEFVWERTFYAILGLVQVGRENGDVYLLDTVAVPDLSPLGEILESDSIIKVLHDAPQDLMILRRASGSSTRNIFDTRLAAGFIGLTSSISLQNLLIELLDIHLDKGSTRTDWVRRPLSPSQLDYAVDDVLTLPKAAAIIRERARAAGVEEWMDQDLRALDNSPRYEDSVPDKHYLRLRDAPSCNPRKLAVLRELASWREARAQELDVPRKRVVEDHELTSIAAVQPTTSADLQTCKRVEHRTINRHEEALLSAVKRGLDVPEDQLPERIFSAKSRSIDKEEVKALIARIHETANARNIDPLLVATNKDAALLIYQGDKATADNNPLLRGWRAELLSDVLSRRV